MKIATSSTEYLEDITPEHFRSSKADVLSFCERSWCNSFDEVPFKAKVYCDNVAVAEFDSYEDWLQKLKNETRARIRRSQKRGLIVSVVPFSDSFVYGVWKIYNDSKIRQGRRFNHYGVSLDNTKQLFAASKNIFLGAYYGNDLVGFIELAIGDDTGQIGQILSLESKRELLINNALIAKAVEVCAGHRLSWLVYARMGNHPSLDEFKRNNGFQKVEIKRFYIPLTLKGKMLCLFGLQRSFKDRTPSFLKPLGFKVYNFINRHSLTWGVK